MLEDRISDTVHAIVPIKGTLAAKSRLAKVLDSERRILLAQTMAEHVLAVLAASDCIAKIWVVTSSPAFAPGGGASTIREPHEAGTQAACLQARSVLRADRSIRAETRLLFINADLPFLTTSGIRMMVQAPSTVVIASDRHQRGSNALVLPLRGAIDPQFGPDSLWRHAEAARQSGHSYSVIDDAGLAFDVDEPADLCDLGEWGGINWRDRAA